MLCGAVVCVVGREYVSVEFGLRVCSSFVVCFRKDTRDILGFLEVGEQVGLLFVTR